MRSQSDIQMQPKFDMDYLAKIDMRKHTLLQADKGDNYGLLLYIVIQIALSHNCEARALRRRRSRACPPDLLFSLCS